MYMTLKGIIFEDFVNYKKPCMTLEFPCCDFKCGSQFCQNFKLASAPDLTAWNSDVIEKYLNNPITEAICFQGLEPFDSWVDMYSFISELRNNYNCSDDIVIYTGYTKEELQEKGYIEKLKNFKNIIIKYGRYIPNEKPHYDDILGVNLASSNQYADRLSINSKEV